MSLSYDACIAREFNVDLILSGLPREMQHEHELIADDVIMTLGSSSAIVAHNLTALGIRVSFPSVIGDDYLGQAPAKQCEDSSVEVTGVKQLPR